MITSVGPYTPFDGTSCTSVEGDSGGTIAWSNPDRAFSDNTSRATTPLVPPTSTLSHYLQSINYGATGWNIPTTSVILGVMVEIEKSRALTGSAQVQDSIVQLVVGGANVGTNKADTVTNWAANDTFAVYGSSTDLWGLTTLTPASFGATFGCVISAKADGIGNATARVDFSRITVWYSFIAGNVTYVVEQTSIGTKVIYAWQSGTDGKAEHKMIDGMNGQLLQMMTVPITCLDNYDITLLDDQGIDCLQSNGLNRDTVNPELKVIFPSGHERNCCYVQGINTFKVENTTALNSGVCIIYYRPTLHSPQVFAMLPTPGEVPSNLMEPFNVNGGLKNVQSI